MTTEQIAKITSIIAERITLANNLKAEEILTIEELIRYYLEERLNDSPIVLMFSNKLDEDILKLGTIFKNLVFPDKLLITIQNGIVFYILNEDAPIEIK